MARPKMYDDSELLNIMVELLAFPQQSGVHTVAEAMRQALVFYEKPKQWRPAIRDQTVDRLKRAYALKGDELLREARRKGRPVEGPMLPTLVTMPRDPRSLHLNKDAIDVKDRLRALSIWAAELSDLLELQINSGAPNPDLLDDARELVDLAHKQHALRAGGNPGS